MQTRRSSDSLREIRTSALTPSCRVTSAWHSSVSILQLQTLPSKLRTASTPQLVLRASVLLRINQAGGETNEITHPANVNASPRLHETMTGVETGKGIGREIVIGGMAPVDNMDLRRRGRDGSSRRPHEGEKEEEKPSVTLPPIVSRFVGTLSELSKFDGRCQPHIHRLLSVLNTPVHCSRSSVWNGRPVTSF